LGSGMSFALPFGDFNFIPDLTVTRKKLSF